MSCATLLLVLTTVTPSRPPVTADDPVPKHLVDARALVKSLTWSATQYEHGPGEIVWSGAVKANCDCSGLIDLLLAHSYGYAEDDFKAWFGAKRPTARRYHDTIADGKVPAWTRVKQLTDARPGDFIAIKYTEAEKGMNTGHLMLIDAVPVEIKPVSAPVEGAAREWHVRVIDSSMSAHGSHDTRYEKGQKHTGVGRGTFRIYTDGSGQVVGYTWSTESTKVVQRQETHNLVVGRLVRK